MGPTMTKKKLSTAASDDVDGDRVDEEEDEVTPHGAPVKARQPGGEVRFLLSHHIIVIYRTKDRRSVPRAHRAPCESCLCQSVPSVCTGPSKK